MAVHVQAKLARRPQRRATLASLAAHLGVSRTTVSNAYNRPDQLSAELRQRVLTVAERLGYSGPDPMARSLRTRQTGTVGVLLTDRLATAFGDPAAMMFLEGLGSICELANTGLLLVPPAEAYALVGPLAGPPPESALASRASVDGFVAYGLPNNYSELIAALARQLPVVIVDSPYEVGNRDNVTWIGIDDFGAGRKLGELLHAFGHRKVGVICGQLDANVRLDGLISGLRLSPAEVPVFEVGDSSTIKIADAAITMLEHHPELTALVGTTDALALGVLQALSARGIRVPDQLSIVGFDDIPAAHEAGLTTINQPHGEKGKVAWELLFRQDYLEPRARRVFPTELMIRTTTGPAPGRPSV